VIFLEDIIRFHLKDIFNAFDFIKIEANAFKITRDAEIYIDNDLDRSILENISMGVRERKKGEPVRMVYDKNMPQDALNYLKEILDLDDYDSMIPGSRYLNKRDFISFPDFGRKDLQYKKISPIVPKELYEATSLMKIISKKDILLYTPYHDYSIFIKFLREAAIDPKVKKIGISIYRVAKDSQVMNALVNASRNGKEVIAVLELTARFDEENNVYWSKELQEEGIKVIFGVTGLKVHSKLVYIEREVEDNSLEKYAVVSSGNFNEKTAAIYTDYTLFTADSRITEEVEAIFQFFEANYLLKTHKHLIVSPLETREKLNKLIDQEIANAKMGLPNGINLKLNSLSDKQMIDKLYEASSAGVKIRMVIRGICCLVPGIKNKSENIEIVSVIDKFLEHSRVYWFKNGGKDKVYISSADLMTRNIDKRVEVFSEIYNQQLKEEIIDCFELSYNDSVKGRLVSDKLSESYQEGKNPLNRSQFSIYEYYKSK
jgi:polyphosphate kinase